MTLSSPSCVYSREEQGQGAYPTGSTILQLASIVVSQFIPSFHYSPLSEGGIEIALSHERKTAKYKEGFY